MIATENQLRVSKDRLIKFRASFDLLNRETPTVDVIKNAQLNAIREQIQSLENEIDEYEVLRSGSVRSFEVQTLLDLPVALIKARISRSLTQTALADLLGVKPQQVQRWESEGYRKVGLDRLAQVASVLGLRVADRVELEGSRPITIAQIKAGLISIGLPNDVIDDRILPSRLDDDSEEILDEVDARLELIFGASASVIASRQLQVPNSRMAFKLPKSASQSKVRPYAQYVEALCRIAAKTCGAEHAKLPVTWQEARQFFLSGGLNLQSIVKRFWDCGVPVLALWDKVAFHGACWTADGRSVVVLKQNHRDVSRWIFDLLHELYHAAHPSTKGEELILEADETSPERRESIDEKRAHRFAAETITDGRLEALTTEIFDEAGGQGPRLKNATIRVAERSGIPTGILANLMAQRLSESNFDWWAVAAKLQEGTDDPSQLVRRVFFECADLKSLSRLERDLLLQAMEPA